MTYETVHFGFDGERITTKFNRAHLRRGAKVYVQKDPQSGDVRFSATPERGSDLRIVTWISQSEWYVELWGPPTVKPERVARIFRLLNGLIYEAVIEQALVVANRDVRIERAHLTSEHLRSRAAVIETVVRRLELYDRLQSEEVARSLWLDYRPLCCYLMLTCFDRLGQPADWQPFDSWLRSGHHQQEVETAFAGAPTSNDIDRTLSVFKTYQIMHGVRSAFFRFLREVLPSDARSSLLSSIAIESVFAGPELGEIRAAGDEAKEQFLYRVRNDYTHRGLGHGGLSPQLHPVPIHMPTWWQIEQRFDEHDLTTVSVNDWPAELRRAVCSGLAEYLGRLAQEGEKGAQ